MKICVWTFTLHPITNKCKRISEHGKLESLKVKINQRRRLNLACLKLEFYLSPLKCSLMFIISFISTGLSLKSEQRDGHILGGMLRTVKGGVTQAEQRSRGEQAKVLQHVPRTIHCDYEDRKWSLQLHDQSTEISPKFLSQEMAYGKENFHRIKRSLGQPAGARWSLEIVSKKITSFYLPSRKATRLLSKPYYSVHLFKKLAFHSLCFFIFVFSIQLTVNKCSLKSLPMTGF